jgi:hypothetical protein
VAIQLSFGYSNLSENGAWFKQKPAIRGKFLARKYRAKMICEIDCNKRRLFNVNVHINMTQRTDFTKASFIFQTSRFHGAPVNVISFTTIRKVRFGLTHADFMEPEGSLPYSQQPYIGSYPEPDQSSPRALTYLLGISFNLTLHPSSSSSKWSLYFTLTHKNSVCISLLPLRATCPLSSSSLIVSPK